MTSKELKKLRLKNGLTQEALSRILECSVYTVQSWENNRNPINRITEIAIKAILKK